jgi:hypothetical protein
VLERGFSSNKLLMCLLKSCAVADRATRNMLVPLFYPFVALYVFALDVQVVCTEEI